jgi:hypothetical protein
MELACEMHLQEVQGLLDLPARLALQPRLDAALEQHRAEVRHIATALGVLRNAAERASTEIPHGF